MKIRAVYFLVLFNVIFLSVSCNVNHGEDDANCVEYITVVNEKLKTPADIKPIKGPQVIPYVYTTAVSLKSLPVTTKKQKFFDMMLPAIMVAKKEIDINKKKFEDILKKKEISHDDSLFIKKLMTKYKANNNEMLTSRLTTFPVSIVLAQAAIESAWGTSRFFVEAENPFGLWSFNTDEERIAASSTRNGTKVYLRKFNDLEQSIDAYFTTLATGPFRDFRQAKLETQDPYKLVEHLIDYSERREKYVEEVTSVIRTNDLTKYDSYFIAPEYIEECK